MEIMNYLKKKYDWNDPDLVNQYDELPLWSSYFGHLLLDNLPLEDYKHYLDVGCGTGFPLIDVCQKIGCNCNGYGIDPWGVALERTRHKLTALQLKNIDLVECSATSIPFENDFFDLITSNVGVNNFSEPHKVLCECFRVLEPQGVMCITSNLVGTFQEFYNLFESAIINAGLNRYLDSLYEHINHRGTVSSITKMFEAAGFKVVRKVESSFSMRFLNGSAFLNHTVINSGFFPAWQNIYTDDEAVDFIKLLEMRLNEYSSRVGEFRVSVPMLYLECTKLPDIIY